MTSKFIAQNLSIQNVNFTWYSTRNYGHYNYNIVGGRQFKKDKINN